MKQKLGFVAVAAIIAVLVVSICSWLGQVQKTVWAAEENQPTPGRPVLRLRDHVVRGAVTAVNDDKVTVETSNGEIATLFITDTTHLWIPGEPPTTTVKLAIDDPVLALGRKVEADGEKALLARVVVIASDEDLPKILIRGRAVAITEKTIVVQAGRSERAMAVLPRTQIWTAQGRPNSLQDIYPGDQIVALGQPTELGQWLALLVVVRGQ